MSEISLFILITMVLLVGVSFLLPIADRLSVPNTILLAILGLVLGLSGYALGEFQAQGLVGEVIKGILAPPLSADAILILFLPPLLFTAGLTIDVRLVLSEMAAVLLLAIVAVIVTTAVVGFALNAVTHVGLVACLLLGAVIATTDPAAVIGVFRDLGAPRRLTALVSGESTFNDAAAIALFTILIEALTETPNLPLRDGILILATEFLGGVVFGFLAAWVTLAMVKHLFNLPLAEITVSVGLAYITYIVGENFLGISGVVAVVVAAMTFSVLGPVQLSPGTWEKLTQTWFQLEFWANSLIFVLTAILASRVLPSASFKEILLLGILIVAAFAARALVLYGLLPLLSLARLAQPVGQRYKAVILWGGLRGALTLTLALSVNQDSDLPQEVRHFVLVLATGYVLFTLFVQAPSLRPLLRLLGLDQLSPTERALRDGVITLSRHQVRDEIEDVTRDYGFDPDIAKPLLEHLEQPKEFDEDDKNEKDEGSDVETTAGEKDAETTAEDRPAVELSEPDSVDVGLIALANREKELYLEHFENGTISRSRVARLITAADGLIDRTKTTGVKGYQRYADRIIRLQPAFRLALHLNRRFGWSAPLAKRIADRFEVFLIMQLVVRDLIRFNRRDVRPLLGEKAVQQLDQLLSDRLLKIEDALAAVDVQYPNFSRELRRRYLIRAALRLEGIEYQSKMQESLISREVYRELERDLVSRWRAVEVQPKLDLGFALTEMVSRVQAFRELDHKDLVFVARRLRPILAVPGQRLLKKGNRGSAMYFIVAGHVEVELPGEPVRLGPGEFVGEMALLSGKPRSVDVRAVGYCHLLALDKREFNRLLRSKPSIGQTITETADARRKSNLWNPGRAAASKSDETTEAKDETSSEKPKEPAQQSS